VNKEKIPFVSGVIMIINLIVFFYMEISGSTLDFVFLLKNGALSFESFFVNNNYYCVITHMFLHSGVEHLMYNMFLLIVVGYYMEKIIGRVWYALIYIFSGVFAGFMSMAWEFYTKDYSISVGASGAVYGVSGALFAVILCDDKLIKEIGIGRLALFLFFMLYVGSVQEDVNYVAHIAGFIFGCVMTCLLIWFNKIRKGKRGIED